MIEKFIENVLFAARWILAPLYLAMSFVLLGLAYVFLHELWVMISHITVISETNFILLCLTMIDMLLIGGLIVMVMFSGYENFVSKIDKAGDTSHIKWLSHLDSGTLKLKVSASIVAISAIFLLKKYMVIDTTLANLPPHATLLQNPLFWQTLIHLVFVVSAVLLALVDKIAFDKKRK
ncbi:TIGR00645 family protein [Actinobacillus delphinicola]|uniref:UPF0114 protein NCTC12871_00228 n=1 Tax=Actinobacillus delphinicola TaxID=51161 RepID=A0A448TSK8_9PAST|nr:TIGR00645 family protein [Actinobacillus delphinicola]MDG6896996.1 TIGR00645 family protein [Actinobacillus delphinicola]VEJ08813.1 Predicted membrane protein [Actinobacillus delphinicola]